jgi:ASC-1-like (ASCH) protein
MSSKYRSSRSTTRRLFKAGNEKSTVLSLNVHREFFDAILAGKKKTEYRANKDYWRRRLVGRAYQEVHFRNGYAAKAPFMRVQFKGLQKYGSGRESYFAIRLGKILELKYYRSR